MSDARYAIHILEEQKLDLHETINDLDSLSEKFPKSNTEKLRTKMTHDIKSLDFAIEILREATHED